MPKAPQGCRWQVTILDERVRVELINSSGITFVRRVEDCYLGAVEDVMIELGDKIIRSLEFAAEIRVRHPGVSIGVE